MSVQIDSILPLSKATWQVRWTEEVSGLDGSPIATSHWEAALDTSIISETSDSSILENPLGFVSRSSIGPSSGVRRGSQKLQ